MVVRLRVATMGGANNFAAPVVEIFLCGASPKHHKTLPKSILVHDLFVPGPTTQPKLSSRLKSRNRKAGVSKFLLARVLRLAPPHTGKQDVCTWVCNR
jgi:hypothetical protein